MGNSSPPFLFSTAVPAFLEDFARESVLASKKKSSPALHAPTARTAAAPASVQATASGRRRRGVRGGRRSRGSGRAAAASSATAAGASADSAVATEAVLAAILATLANLGATAGASQPFMDSGLDSLGAVQVRRHLGRASSEPLPVHSV